MQVQVRLFSHFRQLLPPEARGQAAIEVAEGATVADLLARLGVGDRVKLITVNNRPEPSRERALHEGDTVHIFPPVVGGE